MRTWNLRLLVLSLVALWLTASAHAEGAVKSVGIISAIGDTMTKKKVALMVFGNAQETESIEDWQIDEFVIAEFGAQLAGRYEIKPVNYAKSDFLAKKKGIFADSDFDGEEAIKRVQRAPGSEPDAYIVVTKAFSDDYIARTNQHLFGIGLYHRTGSGSPIQALFASYEINVIDGRTLQYMTDRYPKGALDFGVTGDYDRMIYRTVNDYWSDGFVMSSAQRAKARDEVKAMLRAAVTRTSQDFGFLPKEDAKP